MCAQPLLKYAGAISVMHDVLGGALLADHKIGRHMASMWVTKDEYEEHGLTVAHRKLFPYN